ncbi:DUF3606 domain-containing protein [Variovorax dokdonensis]|uniref:DUF3606 domain-containing protein n=1 Tax=Variovorax dokdonensis TaxID=344883 RepID=A0ABT7NDF4_9BURK|nr:DUF3606 domain-containing protein [Variovorax dokdonensis]MDM0045963.1 DUF3606 domain-containing protein [Variovorax dokdonensis]
MNEDPKTFHPLDPGRINGMDPIELKYWCAQLGCTDSQLHQALAEVGDHVTAVREWLAESRS